METGLPQAVLDQVCPQPSLSSGEQEANTLLLLCQVLPIQLDSFSLVVITIYFKNHVPHNLNKVILLFVFTKILDQHINIYLSWRFNKMILNNVSVEPFKVLS